MSSFGFAPIGFQAQQPRFGKHQAAATAATVIRNLSKNGFIRRSIEGAHEVWVHPSTGRHVTVSNHGSKAIPVGTFQNIKRQSGLSKEMLCQR